MIEKVIIGNCELYCGNSREIVPTLSNIDATITDPPYGVMLGEIQNGQSREKQQTAYTLFSDTPDYIEQTIVPTVRECLKVSQRAAITPGNRNMWLYPKPDDFGVWYNPAGTSRGRWGYSLVVTPILFYGKDPRAGKGSTPSSAWGLCDKVSDIKNKTHPCPKPLLFTKWLVDKASMHGEIVLDPFMGSGTTGVACANMGRRFIGIELEKKYFDIACERISNAHDQQDFFIQKPNKQKNGSLL
jgi:site-specific DNA-methyltransferase (adenine-specific)